MEQSNTILEALKNFVDVNKSNIQRVKVDNPALHDVVLDTLLFLNKKFGNEKITKEDLIQEEIVQEVAKEEEIKVIQPFQFEIGDIFSIASEKDEIPDTLIVVKQIYNQKQNIELEFYNLKDQNYSETPIHVGSYPYSDITNLLNNGTWKVFDLDEIVKVGDTFTNKQNSLLRKINRIVKEERNIYYSSTNLINNITVDYNTEIIVFLRLIKDGEFKKNVEIPSINTPTQSIQTPTTPITPTTPTTNAKPQSNQIELWDIFIDAGTLGVPKIVNQIINEKTASYTIESTNFELDRIVTSDEFKKDVIEQVNNGNLVKYVPFKVDDVLIDTTFNEKVIIKVRRVTKGTLYSINTDEDGNTSQHEYDVVGLLALMYNGSLNFDTSQNVLTVPTAAPKMQLSLPFKVGDKFREHIDLTTPPNYIYTLVEIDNDWNTVRFKVLDTKDNIINNDSALITNFEEDLRNGKFVPYVEPVVVVSPPTPPTPSSILNYKVGDKFIKKSDTEIPPKYTYTIIKINKDWDSITYNILDTKSNTIQEYGDSIRDFEEELLNDIFVPYIEPATVTSTPAPQPTPKSTFPFKTGDRLREMSNAEPPQIIIDIVDIDANDVTYLETNTGTSRTTRRIESKTYFENRMNNFIPYVLPTINAKAKVAAKAAKTPKPPKSNPPVVNLSCREIKNAIKDLTLLIDLGDNSVMQELNEFKQLLKTQNCK
jgi:hypothetical protein